MGLSMPWMRQTNAQRARNTFVTGRGRARAVGTRITFVTFSATC